MTTSDPDDLPPEFLAAYTDGELGPCDSARVERWLADHPEARELVEEQEALGPRNADFWRAVSPPQPPRRAWDETLALIRERTRRSVTRRWLPWVGSLALAATATAATLLFVLPPAPSVGPERPPIRGPVVETTVEPFAMASADEVQIISLPESAARMLVVGEHPLRDALVVLARADEIEFFGVNTDPDGRFPEMPAEIAPEDAPMIWAPKAP
jgi:anti-sigma factor RsiW